MATSCTTAAIMLTLAELITLIPKLANIPRQIGIFKRPHRAELENIKNAVGSSLHYVQLCTSILEKANEAIGHCQKLKELVQEYNYAQIRFSMRREHEWASNQIFIDRQRKYSIPRTFLLGLEGMRDKSLDQLRQTLSDWCQEVNNSKEDLDKLEYLGTMVARALADAQSDIVDAKRALCQIPADLNQAVAKLQQAQTKLNQVKLDAQSKMRQITDLRTRLISGLAVAG